ncbi:DUF3883 domain-containing protein [Microcoleus sp. MON1_C1]|uniref:DUF3883 domain-containing protein n=1 Tax=Microcoleus sp. MON1_C1 TaxID=2818827 RepID=UPI002FD0A9CE
MDVFLMHVGQSNTIDLGYTVSRTFCIQEVVNLLPDDAPEKSFFASEELRSCFPNGMFNCWGVPVKAKPSFEKTKVGDLVAFAPEIGEHGGIDYFGFVKSVCPVSCHAASRILWPETPNARFFPWLFFFDTELGHVPWATFLEQVQYAPNWNPRGWYRRIDAKKFKVWGGGQGYAQHLRSNFGFTPLTSPTLDTNPEIDEAIDARASITGKPRKSLGQGFRSTPEVRRAIEMRAMNLATEHFQDQGWVVEDVSQQESYDLRCTRQEERIYVEVKGTTSEGSTILLTPNTNFT